MAIKRNKSRKPGSKDIRAVPTRLQKALLDEANRTVSITSDGRQQNVRVEQVVTRKLLQMAANGSVHSLSNAVNEINVAQRLEQRGIDEDVTFGYRLHAHQKKLLERALKAGQDPNSVLPHPDDIEVIPGVGYRVLGPWDETELKIIRSNCTRRDVLILQATLEDRLSGAMHDPERSAEIGSPGKGSALIMVQFLNHGLPARFRKSTIEIVMDLARHARMSKRALLKAAHGAWASIGRPKPRGWTTPPGQITTRRVERLQDDCVDLLCEIVAGGVIGVTATAARVEEMMSEGGASIRPYG